MQSGFDATAATDAYLATVSGIERQQSDAYFVGGYWLQLWDLLFGLVVAWLLLRKGLSARIRDWTISRSKRPFIQSGLYGGIYIMVSSLLLFPWLVYTGYLREHQYGLATQSFGPWLGDQAIGLVVSVVVISLFAAVIYAVIRKTSERWWLWGTAVTAAFLALIIMVSPVFIAPLFNEYKPLNDSALEAEILEMAESQNVEFDHVYMYDASAQTNRVSANVSGLGATKRISLNDNLLNSGTPAEIKAVMGHELGHYVLGHSIKLILAFSLVFGFGYFLLTKTYQRVVRRWGSDWRLAGIEDPAGFPLAVALFSIYLFLMSPVLNSIIRINESEADLFGLNVAQEPEGAATMALKVAQYRKLDPGPIEEIIFYDHPSGRTRIQMAMEWKADQVGGRKTP
jgi:STE24 endopeptidase